MGQYLTTGQHGVAKTTNVYTLNMERHNKLHFIYFHMSVSFGNCHTQKIQPTVVFPNLGPRHANIH